MTNQKRILIVTQEYSPITGGGIGVLVERLVRNYENKGHLVSVLCNFPKPVDVEENFTNVEFIGQRDIEEDLNYLPDWAYTDSHFHAISLRIWRHIELMLREIEFDFVEFSDYQGLAFSTIFGLREISAECKVTIRVHSPDYLLRKYDFNPYGGLQKLWSHNLEIVSLLETDSIIIHSTDIGKHLLSSLKNLISDEGRFRIQEKIQVEELTFLQDDSGKTVSWNGERIIFASKIQQLKSPEVFVKALINYLRKSPSFLGEVVFTALVVDEELKANIIRRIPHDLRGRFVFYENLSRVERIELFKDSLVCIPSTHESLSLLAHEVLDSGGIPLLNSKCAAFGDGSVWLDRVNCIKFDGTASNLSRVLLSVDESFTLTVPPRKHLDVLDFYTNQPSCQSNPEVIESSISVVIAHFNMSAFLLETLTDILALNSHHDEVIVVDDGSDPSHLDVVKKFLALDPRIRIVELGSNFGLPSARNIGIAEAKNDLILILDSDDFVTQEFLNTSRSLLSRDSADVIVPQVAMFTNHLERISGKFQDFAAFQGVGTFAGAFENRLGSATIMAKKNDLVNFQYNEEMNSFEDWELLARMGCAGKRIHIHERIGLHYRTRLNSMVRTDGSASREKNLFILRQNYDIPASSIKNFEDYRFLNVNPKKSARGRNFILVKLAERRLVILRILTHLQQIPLVGRLAQILYQRGRAFARKRGLGAVPIR